MILIWEAADRICGKRLKAALPHLVEATERHGHLDLDPRVRERLLSASAATLDRPLQPIRTPGSRRFRRRRNQSPGRNIPVRTFADWNAPLPGFLGIDLVVYHGGFLWGSMIHSLVATDICTGWTEAVPLLGREQALVVAGLEAIASQLPFPVLGIDSDNDRVFINDTLTQYCVERGPDASAMALLGRLQEAEPGRFSRAQLRTLQRRVQQWRGIMAEKLVYATAGESMAELPVMPEPAPTGADPRC